MTKRKIWAACFAVTAVLTANAQNVQFHYDFGHALYGSLTGRPNVTTTIEMFKPDDWGNTYFFTDIDYFSDGAAGAYWEISREFNISSNKQWALHAEYNGGMTSIERTTIASRFQHAALAGGTWNWANSDFTRTFSLQALYKHYFHGFSREAFESFQATAVWGDTFAHGMLTFSGYIDVWYDATVNGSLIVSGEPQFWFNFNALKGCEKIKLSVGTEVEISNNFVVDDKGRDNRFYAIPTMAAKWTF